MGDLSDSMEPAADLLRLGGFARKCMVLFKGMEVELKDGNLSLTALTHIPFFRAPTERYNLQGKLSVYNRRDMRKGQFSGYIKAREDGGINFFYRWNEPFSGHCCDEIVLEDGGSSLIITTTLTLERGESCVYRVVYRRANQPAMPPSPHLLKRIEMMKSAAQPHLHPRVHSHLHVKTARASHQPSLPKERDSSRSIASSHNGSQGYSRRETQEMLTDAPSGHSIDRDRIPTAAASHEMQRTSDHLLSSPPDDEKNSPRNDAMSSQDASSSPFDAANGSRPEGQVRNSMDSAVGANHTANGGNRGRRERGSRGKRWGEDIRRSSATFSEFLKL